MSGEGIPKPKKSEWFGRRWYDFRTGYQTYMVFLFGFSNFILILYNFAPELKEILDLEIFAIIVFAIIIPLGVIIGHNHNKKQLPTETKIQHLNSAYRDYIIPDSKETLSTHAAIFQTEFAEWQIEVQRKQFMILNKMNESLGLGEHLMYVSELEELDKFKGRLGKWEQDWKKYLAGNKASSLVKPKPEPEQEPIPMQVPPDERLNLFNKNPTKEELDRIIEIEKEISSKIAEKEISEVVETSVEKPQLKTDEQKLRDDYDKKQAELMEISEQLNHVNDPKPETKPKKKIDFKGIIKKKQKPEKYIAEDQLLQDVRLLIAKHVDNVVLRQILRALEQGEVVSSFEKDYIEAFKLYDEEKIKHKVKDDEQLIPPKNDEKK